MVEINSSAVLRYNLSSLRQQLKLLNATLFINDFQFIRQGEKKLQN